MTCYDLLRSQAARSAPGMVREYALGLHLEEDMVVRLVQGLVVDPGERGELGMEWVYPAQVAISGQRGVDLDVTFPNQWQALMEWNEHWRCFGYRGLSAIRNNVTLVAMNPT